MTFTVFLQRLQAIDCGSASFKIIDASHPYFIYYGRNRDHATALWIRLSTTETKTEKETPKSTRCIDAQVVIDERTIDVTFSLKETPFKELFDSFCFDLFDHLAKTSVEDAFIELVNRYDAWRHLFEQQKKRTLSGEEIKGLLGELLTMKHFLDQGRQDAVVAWGGPTKADRDFEFHDTWAESKSVKLDASTVSISSLEQLDVVTPGALHLFRIEKGPADRADAFSLMDIVEKCSKAIASTHDMILFNNKLQLGGYDPSDEGQSERVYTLHEHTVYTVTNAFPRIVRGSVPPEVAKAHYELYIPMLSPFKSETLFQKEAQS